MKWAEPKEFNELLLLNPSIIDCQPNVHDYIHQHIAGAVYVNEESVRLSKDGMPHVWLPDELAQLLLRQLGVSNRRPVAIYSSQGADSNGDGMAQMVLAYSLARYGHENISILDGGLEKWKEESFPVTQMATKVERGDFLASSNKDCCASTRVLESALDTGSALVIDTRLPELYRGDSGFPKPGHIPSSVNLPWTELVMPSNPCQIRNKSDLQMCVEKAGVKAEIRSIIYCATGRKSAALFNIMRFLLHLQKVWLYEGSFTEWCAEPSRKTVIGPLP
jgi:thiosulfate/3-mercaptopyruvate sulfurtransferase